MTDMTIADRRHDEEAERQEPVIDHLRDEAIAFAQQMVELREACARWKALAERRGADLEIMTARLDDSERRYREATFKAERYIRAVVATDTRADLIVEAAKHLVEVAEELKREARDAARMSQQMTVPGATAMTAEEQSSAERIGRKFGPLVGGIDRGDETAR